MTRKFGEGSELLWSPDILGVPKGILEPANLLEMLMKGFDKQAVLLYVARTVTREAYLGDWKLIDRNAYRAAARCRICGFIIDMGQKTYGKKTQQAVAEHGHKHIEEALAGKFHNK